ncbi:type IV toxin-antitoxin system AbiEi family antitoxin [Serratia ficaria]|uniref:type IV toxin-antitoxin system AbiEi family antitoxin n=1 Tax=Serratia TaxID=613 RepID=UPI001013C85C|nr:type IV toxin-antitoxin system AbiEi family antitoxin [Serratia sp. 1D1416]MEE4482606.1 type IV toxin-antitoxin system AbiEi family antitoxin [Serratia ficaria]
MSILDAEEELLASVRANLPAGMDLTTTLQPDHGDDGHVCLSVSNNRTFTFKMEIKIIRRKENLLLLRKSWDDRTTQERLLICSPLTPTQIKICEALKLNFIDAAGNASINTEGLFLRVSGRKAPKNTKNFEHGRVRISEGTLKLLFVLLTDTDAINATYRELANMAGISLGMVSKALDYLETQRYYRKSQTGRRLLAPEALTALWLREYAVMLRPKQQSISLTAPTDWQHISLHANEVWGGEAAAALMTNGFLNPEKLILFTHEPLQQRRKELGLRPEREGKMQLATAFWGHDWRVTTLAKAMLSIGELLASQDDRNLEVARIVNDQYLGLTDSALFRD